MKILSFLIAISSVLFFVFLTIQPLFFHGVFPIHDDTQVARVFEMAKALRDGHFPVRWVADLGFGYGYPLFNFYAPLAYYIGALVNLIGFSTVQATKVMMGIGIGLSALTMFLFAKTLWGKSSGVIASALYLFAPYHAVNIYVRGDVAEYFAYAFYPLVFLGMYKLATQSKAHLWFFVTAVSYAAVILSHNLSAFMFTPFLLLYILFLLAQIKKEDRIAKAKRLFLSFFTGVLLSAFYWFPTLFEMKYTNVFSQIGGGADFRDHFVCLSQLWQSQWGFGGSAPGCIDGLSLMLGKIHMILGAMAVILFILWGKRETIIHRHEPFLLFCVFLAIFFMLPLSKPVWETVPFMEFLQYPWRFLGIAVFFLSLLGGSVGVFLQDKATVYAKIGIVIALVGIIGFTYNEYFTVQTIHKKTSDELTSEYALKWVASKISDEYMPPEFQKPNFENEIVIEKMSIPANAGGLIIRSNETDELHATVVLSTATLVKINTAYFPAWKLTVNNKEASYIVRDNGLYVQLPAGSHEVSLQFVQTITEKTGNAISIVGIFLTGIVIIHMRKKHINVI